MKRKCFILSVALACLIGARVHAQGPNVDDLMDLSISELVELRITSVSKREESISNAAAAVYVITQEDIHRSGVRTLAEALRMVPGIQVARVDANKWAVSARGFNARFSSHLLVLIDGRIVYTPTFSGVFWEVQNAMLPDIERIEVIRGPGATLWGVNAVNGVINILTKASTDTQGTYVEGAVGNIERGFLSARHGAQHGNLAYRFYGQGFNRGEFVTADGDPAEDGWKDLRGGFRLDWTGGARARDTVTFQGDLYTGAAGTRQDIALREPPFQELAIKDVDYTGGDILGRWTRQLSAGSSFALQSYYDREHREDITYADTRQSFEVEFQYNATLGERHSLVAGAGTRIVRDEQEPTFSVSYRELAVTQKLWNVFVQDQITLRDDLFLTVGTKFEHNPFTGMEIQPSIRMLGKSGISTIWGAISRAARTPNRANDAVRFVGAGSVFPDPTTGLLTIATGFGNPDLKADKLTAYELGYRVQARENVYIDIAAFYNDFDDLLSLTGPFPPFLEGGPPPDIIVPFSQSNDRTAKSYGGEVLARWEPIPRWKLTGSYAYLRLDLTDPTGLVLNAHAEEGESPRNAATFRSFFNVTPDVQLDAMAYFVGALTDVASYVRLDLRLGWRPRDQVELQLIGRNLLDSQRAQSSNSFSAERSSEVRRGVLGVVNLRF